MVTLLLEVVRPDSPNGFDFYNPALDTCRAYPRTCAGVEKAIKRLFSNGEKINGVESMRIACYNGKREYWNEKEFLGYINP